MLQAAHRIGSRALKDPLLWAIAAAAFAAIFAAQAPFPLIVLGAARAAHGPALGGWQSPVLPIAVQSALGLTGTGARSWPVRWRRWW